LTLNWVLKSQELGQRTYPELPVLYWLFCENHQLFEFFQKPRTGGSFDSENTKKTRT